MESVKAPVDEGLGGWLGRYQAALRRTTPSVEERHWGKSAEHQHDRGR